VCPNPLQLRAVSSSDSTIVTRGRQTEWMAICATRSPRRKAYGDLPKLMAAILISPRSSASYLNFKIRIKYRKQQIIKS
jgi:hypothetical protein